MPIDTNAIIKLINDVMGERQIQVAAKQAMKGALMTGACSFIGGMVAGPIGLAIGGASGGVLAAFHTNGTFKPIAQILNELPYDKKERIAIEVQSILDQLQINDLAEFVRLAAICHSLSESQQIPVQDFIARSLPVIQRYIEL